MSIIYLHIYGLIIDPHNDPLPVDLIAQPVEHRTNITEVGFASSFKPEKFRPERGCCSAKMRWSNSFNISACLKILQLLMSGNILQLLMSGNTLITVRYKLSIPAREYGRVATSLIKDDFLKVLVISLKTEQGGLIAQNDATRGSKFRSQNSLQELEVNDAICHLSRYRKLFHVKKATNVKGKLREKKCSFPQKEKIMLQSF